jgi:hypothetical protein
MEREVQENGSRPPWAARTSPPKFAPGRMLKPTYSGFGTLLPPSMAPATAPTSMPPEAAPPMPLLQTQHRHPEVETDPHQPPKLDNWTVTGTS